ncbi:hypothetical protein [Spiroplasma cantharicola]|uniref:Uncharacterized protein n=1 Tax=Spiroplasma cantharicola TaxID=362837 RepID=A0A0M4JI49_9MOLU|nr:hypothetical protein [Spiroplasma cantharicola]ALD66203.1 hypothetical protein SCANT_v1c02930 [Spiroplasma cantharicola]
MKQDIFKAFERILKDIIPSDVLYVLKQKYETDQTYEFILVIQEKDQELFKNKKNEGFLEAITNICNSEISIFSKKIIIDLEVLELHV